MSMTTRLVFVFAISISSILFGFLWGMCGLFLILQDTLLMNVWLAVLIGWILRAKIDRINHGIAASIILGEPCERTLCGL